jgi:hypothetical protein
MQRASFGDGSLTSARIVYLFSKRRDLITLAAAAMLSAPFIAMLSKKAPVSYATEALPLGVPAIFSPEYVTMDPPCCDLMHRPHCELSDACYSVLCKEIPTRNPYTMGTRRHVKGMDVYDVANFSSSSPHVVFIPSSPFAAWLGRAASARCAHAVSSLCTCCFQISHALAELVSPDDCDAFMKHGSEHLKRSVTFVDEATGEMKPTSWRTSHDSGVLPNQSTPSRSRFRCPSVVGAAANGQFCLPTNPVPFECTRGWQVDPNFKPLKRLHAKLQTLLNVPASFFEGAVILRYRSTPLKPS